MSILCGLIIALCAACAVLAPPVLILCAVVRDLTKFINSRDPDKWNFHRSTECRSCFKLVSPQADKCPHCRDPHPAWRN